MRLALSFLLLFPVLCSAQTEAKDPAAEKSDGKLSLIHADKTFTRPAVKKEGEKKKLKDDEVYYGNVKFKVGDNEITADSAVYSKNEDQVTAYNISVSSPLSFLTKADKMTFSKETAISSVSSKVTVSAQNGDLVGTSEWVELDFNYRYYHLGRGTLAIPEKKEAQ